MDYQIASIPNFAASMPFFAASILKVLQIKSAQITFEPDIYKFIKHYKANKEWEFLFY